ncbi:DUF5681 domain-containing protein [Sphingomonadaceae bacterium G21617-S1]|nr:DUF5681 domain-containing protein [Sphingomonadaceae bacterium G21617-S1]
MTQVDKFKSKGSLNSKRKPKTFGHEAFDVLFDVPPRKKGAKGPPRSLNRRHNSFTFSNALLLRPKSVVLVLEMIKANDKAIREALKGLPRPYDDDFGDYEFPDPGNANRALVILDIAVIKTLGDSDTTSLLKLEPWAVEAGIQRYGKRYMHPADKAAIARHTKKLDEIYEDWTAWPSLPLPEPPQPKRPKGPSFEEQKFKPGQSGNSKGRPPKPKFDVPYPFLNETGLMEIDGQIYRLTRSQAFLRMIATATFSPDSSLPQTTAKLMMDITKERWQRPPTELPKYGERTPGQMDFSGCMEFLFMARKLNRMRACRRMVIQPWLVEMALDGLSEEPPLSLIEQKIVVEATRTPWKVKWPSYWEAAIPSRRKAAE